MAETYPTDAELLSLAGSAEPAQERYFGAQNEDPHMVSVLKELYRRDLVMARAGDLRAYQDGDLTFGVRPGRWFNGDSVVPYAGATARALTDDATNYIYLTAAGVLTVNTTGFPTPSATPHIPLAEIATGSASADADSGYYEEFDGDLIDRRGAAFVAVSGNEGEVFFAATDISGAEAETLSDGSNADALHIHAAAGLAAALQDVIPYLVVATGDDADGTGTASIQVKDAAGNDLAQRFRVRTWFSTSDFGAPVAATTDYSVTTGTELRELTADADYEVITDATGLVEMNIVAADGTYYVMAEIDGRVYSASVAITGN